MHTRVEQFELEGHAVAVTVPVLQVDQEFVAEDGTVFFTALQRFIFFQGEEPLSRKVGAGAMGVYSALLAHANHQTRLCRPSAERLGRLLNASEKTIRGHLKRLCKHGLIVRLPRFKGTGGAGGRGVTDWYYINTPQVETGGFSKKPVKTTVFGGNQVKTTEFGGKSVGSTEYEDPKVGNFRPKKSVKTTDEQECIEQETTTTVVSSEEASQIVKEFYTSPNLNRRGKQRKRVEKWAAEQLTEHTVGQIIAACRAAEWADDPAGVGTLLENFPRRAETEASADLIAERRVRQAEAVRSELEKRREKALEIDRAACMRGGIGSDLARRFAELKDKKKG